MVYKRQAEEMILQDQITPSSNQTGRVSILKASDNCKLTVAPHVRRSTRWE